MCVGENTSLEVLNLLNILTRQYPFFKLRQPEQQLLNVDLEQRHLLDFNIDNKIQSSDLDPDI